MGKSSGCLRIMACGGGSLVEANEAGPVDQAKRKKEKKGWSFKKKASTNRAVTNSLIMETPSFEPKVNVDLAARQSFVSEKDSTPQWDEKSLMTPQVARDLPASDAVIVHETEKQAATADANSYVADEVSSPLIDKKPATADAISYVADEVSSPLTNKKPDTAAANSYVADDVLFPETEKHSDAANLCATGGLTVPKTGEYEAVLKVHESDVIVIQSAVRGFLARKELESVIKLQAMVRGHLVRCRAVGALRCVQAIAKMQVLVRDRYARTRKDCIPPKRRPDITYTSMTDLLKNSFARQLLESSLKSKPIKIKCDPLTRDSSWVWLERWMSLASPGAVDDSNAGNESQELKNLGKECEDATIDKEKEEKITVDDYLFNEENEIFLDARDTIPPLSREHSKLDATEEPKVTNSAELTLTHSKVDSHSANLTESQKLGILNEAETNEAVAEESSVSHTGSKYSQPEIVSVDKDSSKTEQALELGDEVTDLGNKVCKEFKTEVEVEETVQLHTETENIVSVSQEEPVSLLVTESELVPASVSANLSESVLQDAGAEEPISETHLPVVYHDSIPSKGETEEGPASVTNSATDYIHASQNGEAEQVAAPNSSTFDLNDGTTASSENDIVINHDQAIEVERSSIQVGESDCSTDLSITSTIDSPDRSEIEPVKVELEKVVPGDVEPQESKTNTAGHELKIESVPAEKGKSDFANGESAVYAIADNKELETNVSALEFHSEAGAEKKDTKTDDLHAEPEGDAEKKHQASPGSQVSFSESQGTPSSQVSVTKKSKIVNSGKSGSIKKRTILSAVKKSPMNISSEKNSSEQQTNEHNSAKRRTSFGSPKPEVSDQEQRRSSSTSSSLPSYMQATESARAKANAVGQSPRSSPDVPDNDVFLRKRHSLSSTKDKHDSPRLSRTSSQAHSGTKSNGTSPLERKWQR